MSNAVKVTAANWESEVMNSDIPVIVDLWAEWCGPCRALSPVLDEVGAKYEGKVKVVKVNVDEERGIAQAFEIQSIPTLGVVYRGGLVGKIVGFGGKPQIESVFADVAQLPEKIAESEKAEGTAATPPEVPEA